MTHPSGEPSASYPDLCLQYDPDMVTCPGMSGQLHQSADATLRHAAKQMVATTVDVQDVTEGIAEVGSLLLPGRRPGFVNNLGGLRRLMHTHPHHSVVPCYADMAVADVAPQ